MSLVRLALRAATVAALETPVDGQYLTMAGPLVFDSKMDALEDTVDESIIPCVLVYTGKDEQKTLDKGPGVVFTERCIHLTIECVLNRMQKDGKGLAIIQTDPEMEAMLDIFEWQVWRALNDSYSPSSAPYRSMIRRYEGWSSEPAHAANQAQRIALRQILIEAVVNNDCRPAMLALQPGQQVQVPEAKSLLNVPYLANLEQQIKTGATTRKLVEHLREARTGIPSKTLPTLQTISFGYYTAARAPDGSLVAQPATRVDAPVTLKRT